MGLHALVKEVKLEAIVTQKIVFVNVRKWKMLARMVRFVILSLDVALDKPESA